MKKKIGFKSLVLLSALAVALLWAYDQPVMAEQPVGFRASTLTVQPDGKLIVAGYSNNGGQDEFALVRYNADRSLDQTFGKGGKVTTAIGTSNDRVLALAIQKDGKIVAAGHSHRGSQYELALVRYNKNGSLDLTFGGGGKVTTPLGSSYEEGALKLSIQTDGKMIVAGNSHTGSQYEFALARYNADGSLDQTFGSTGIATALGTLATK